MAPFQNPPIPGGFPDQADVSGDHSIKAEIQAVSQIADSTSPKSVPLQMTADSSANSFNTPAKSQHTSDWDGLVTSAEEEEDIAKAVEMSLTEQRDVQARVADSHEPEGQAVSNIDDLVNSTGPMYDSKEETPFKKSKPRNSIQAMVDNLALRLSNEFTPIFDKHGDTLLYIGAPSKTKDQSNSEYAHIKKHFDRFYRIDSSKLKGLNSRRFDKLLSPNACIFAEKRLKKLDAYKKVTQDVRGATKYHIDLRPPNEDEEAVILLTELSCSQGVRSWHLAQKKYDLPSTAVAGIDELDTETNPYFVDHLSFNAGTEDDDRLLNGRRLDPTNVPDYSALRHHSALERLLHAIYGDDPKLDSAPKMWTFFAAAQYFECAHHSSISKWILSWLSATGNRNFIQNNPEVSYRLGMGIMDAELVKDAFSILVGEKALMDICREVNGTVLQSSVSVHGRRQENLDDDEQNRVSHAASSMVHRMTDFFRSVVVDLDWIYSSKEYQKLLDVTGTTHVEHEVIQEAKDLLQGFVKGRFLKIIGMGLASSFSELDLSADETAPFRHGTRLAFDVTYSQLHQEARPFTRSFWIALSRARFYEGVSNLHVAHISELKEIADGLNLTGVKNIETEAIRSAISKVNSILTSREGNRWLSNTSLFGTDKRQFCENDNAAVAPRTLGALQQIPADPPIDPPLNSPKRANNASERFPTSAGKRRRTMDKDEEAFSLPYRPVDLARRADPALDRHAQTHPSQSIPTSSTKSEGTSVIAHHSEARSASEQEARFDADMFNMDDKTNRERNLNLKPIVSRHTQLSPPDARQQFQSWAREDAITSSTDVRRDSDQSSQYVRDFDRQSGLPFFKLASTSVVPSVNTKNEQEAEKVSASDALPFTDDQKWYFDSATRTWIMPNKRQDFPRVAQPSSASQPAGRKAVQQFSNTNTPRAGSSKVDKTDSERRTPGISGSTAGNQPWMTENSWYSRLYPISPMRIIEEFSEALVKVCDEIIYPPQLFHGTVRLPVDLLDHLLHLDESETKFLPLWAGGFDDGSGGVFDDMDVPNLEAGGFKGGKRGISNVSGMYGEGSVSGSESSFDDIASAAVSTVGKASKAATDGTQTVKSLSDNGSSESDTGFMNQDDVYEIVNQMRMDEIRRGKMKEVDPRSDIGANFDLDEDDGDASTIMGAGSDIQGDMFGDIDDDGDDANESSNQDMDDNQANKNKGKARAVESDDEMDLEIIDMDSL